MTALMGIATRLKLARLFFVTDARDGLATLVEGSCQGGADVVALQDPADGRPEALKALATVRRAAQSSRSLIAFQGPADIAAEFGADLLLLRVGVDAAWARRALSPWALVGRSCHSDTDVDAALADAAIDFLLVGPGLEHIKYAARVAPADDPASKPWFAAGGITDETLDIVLQAGAMRVAVGRGIRDAPDPQRASRAFADRLRAAWAANPNMDAVRDAAFGHESTVDLPATRAAALPTDLTI